MPDPTDDTIAKLEARGQEVRARTAWAWWRSFETVSRTNLERALCWHPGGLEEWSPLEWGGAAAGELGELCNVLKKLKRFETGLQQASGIGRAELLEKAAQEIGDTFLYLDLVCARLGLDFYDCVCSTFNRVSLREGFAQQLRP